MCLFYVRFYIEVVDCRRPGGVMFLLSNKMKELRKEYNLTQYQLAKITGLTRRGILQIEKYNQDISLSNAFKIANAFGKRIEEVFAYEG